MFDSAGKASEPPAPAPSGAGAVQRANTPSLPQCYASLSRLVTLGILSTIFPFFLPILSFMPPGFSYTFLGGKFPHLFSTFVDVAKDYMLKLGCVRNLTRVLCKPHRNWCHTPDVVKMIRDLRERIRGTLETVNVAYKEITDDFFSTVTLETSPNSEFAKYFEVLAKLKETLPRHIDNLQKRVTHGILHCK